MATVFPPPSLATHRRKPGLPWPIAVVSLILGHLGVALIFALGRTVNRDIGFTVTAIKTLSVGPIAPVLHLVAAVVLIVALARQRGRWQTAGAVMTAAVWCGQATLLYSSAIARTAPIPLYAQILVVPILVIAAATAFMWGLAADDED